MADCKDYLQKLSEISAIKYVILRSLLENALKKVKNESLICSFNRQ